MGNKHAIYALIREISLKQNLYKITTESIRNYGKTKISTATAKGVILQAADLQSLESILIELEVDGKISLEYIDKMLHRVVYNDFFSETVKFTYEKMKIDPHLPFPIPEMFKQDLPPNKFVEVDVKKEFVTWLEKEDAPKDQILKLILPQFQYSLLVMTYMLRQDLLDASIDKIASYLEKESNYDYIQSRIITILKSDNDQVRRMMKQLKAKDSSAYRTILNPNAFSFVFWSHLATSIIKEYQAKKSVYVGDYVYAQAAYLIGFYNVYYKGRTQQTTDKGAAIEKFDQLIKKEPYCFSLNDFYSLKDDAGTSIAKICGKDEFNQHIQKLISELDSTGLPELVLIRLANNKEYFICREIYAKYLLKQLSDVREEIKIQIEDSWKESLESYKKTSEMKSDADFEKLLKKRLRNQAPIVLAMLDYTLIMRLILAGVIKEAQKLELSSIIDEPNGKLRPYSIILDLNRTNTLADVRLLLPVHKSNGFLSALSQFISRLFGGKPKESGKKKKKKAKNMEFTKIASNEVAEQIEKLKEELFGKNINVPETMDQLIAQWNPLIDKIAKANLVEDVNNLLKDYIRKFKKSYAQNVPDRERVQMMADQLSKNDAFSEIKHKESLKRYIILYIINALSAMNLYK